MEMLLMLLLSLGLLVGLLLLVNWLFAQANVRTYAHFPKPLKITFYILWMYFNIIGIANIISLGQADALLSGDHLFYDMSVISWSVIVLFFPLHVMLVKFIRSKQAAFSILISILSLIACWALFLHATFFELFRDVSMKPGG